MKDTNRVVLIGNLTADKVIGETKNGTKILKFSVACNSDYFKADGTKQKEVSFFQVENFGKMADGIGQYLVKGKQVAIEGRLKQETWEKDGQKRSAVKIIADSVQLLGGGKTKSDAPSDADGNVKPPVDDSIPF